jgi:mannan endo-1,4-beta-mannosidase
MLTRRATLGAGLAGASGCSMPRAAKPGFIATDGARLLRDGAPYRFSGANMWYGAYLGAANACGDSDRLKRELDALVGIGITNLRVLGSGEDSPLRNSLKPAFRTQLAYNEELLAGLDHLLAQMGERGMRAVVYLTNFWEWSGGMATYLYWTNGGHFINMNDPAHPWPEFADFSSQFYASGEAVALYRDYVRALVARTNSVTGVAYRDDPTIMSWQLANEPRPGGGLEVAQANMPAFLAWIGETAALIKSLDPNHLVSTGSEGLKGCVELEQCVIDAHAPTEIDYVTAHIWPQNWGWVDPTDIAGTYAAAEANARDYIDRHVRLALGLNKALVIEEFGFPRDDASFAPGSPTTFRDRFYGIIQESVRASAANDGPLIGSNFWAWGGEGRAAHADLLMRVGDCTYVGDPPHEPQGWYSVFDADASTIALLRAHGEALAG